MLLRHLRTIMRKFIALVLAGLLIAVSGRAQAGTEFKRTEDVVYGHKFGMALTMDVFQPTNSNGLGIISVVSGGWFSAREAIYPPAYQPLLERGYTVFAVLHGSQPKFIIPEIIQDMHRAVRYIRHNAAHYGIDPGRLGVVGGSAGGHLSLILATQCGSDVETKSKDPVDHESSAIQCDACFFPPTDFLNYGGPGIIGDGVGVLKDFKSAFGPLADTEEGRQKLGREISPIYYISSNLPPVLIFHGDADTLVPIQQSESFVRRAREAGATAKLIVKKGASHGWPDLYAKDMYTCADWFDDHLRNQKKPQ
jgi:acetyl esterase/lipase